MHASASETVKNDAGQGDIVSPTKPGYLLATTPEGVLQITSTTSGNLTTGGTTSETMKRNAVGVVVLHCH